MSKFSDLFGQEVSRQESKAASDAVWAQENGTSAYSLGGKIFVGCGAVWILLSFIPIACKNPISNYICRWIISPKQNHTLTIIFILSK